MSELVSYDKVEMLAPETLVPYAKNSRTHSPEQVDQIVASIREFGFTNPILIAEDGTIIAGHGRVVAASKIGMKTVPCLRLAGLSEEQRRAYIIADNKLAENAGWDEELLKLELGVLRDAGFGLDVIGFSTDELDELFLGDDDVEQEGKIGDDEIPAFGDFYTSRKGDVWICGDHRVMCGDSTVMTDVDALIVDQRVDMCWTDPPYNVDYEGSAGKIENDALSPEAFQAFQAFLSDAFALAIGVMKKGAAIYVAHADTEGLVFRSTFIGAGFKLSGCLVWVKPSLVLGRSDYQWRHEPILYGWKPGAAHRWYGGRAKTTVMEAEEPPFVTTPDGAVQIEIGSTTLRIAGNDLSVAELVGSVIRHEKPTRNAEHPTMKPVGLIIGMMTNSSRRGDLVYDPFGGSGSTLIAAQKIGRKARLMELDRKFADVIVRRWQEFTGGKAYLEETGEAFDDMTAQRKTANAEQA